MMKNILILICFLFSSNLVAQINRNILRDSVVSVTIDTTDKWLLSIKFFDEVSIIVPDTLSILQEDSVTLDTVIIPGSVDTIYSYFVKEFNLKANLQAYVSSLFNLYREEITAANTTIEKHQNDRVEINKLIATAQRRRFRAIRQADNFRNLLDVDLRR